MSGTESIENPISPSLRAPHPAESPTMLPLDPSDRSPILELHPHGKIIAVHVEGDLHILAVQEWSGRIVKASNLAAGQNEPTNGVHIARSAFDPISQMQSAHSSSSVRLTPFLPTATRVIRSGVSESMARTVASAVTSDAT
jgi:hypothetical protein